jgi:PD-(D/E)XK endonuclease
MGDACLLRASPVHFLTGEKQMENSFETSGNSPTKRCLYCHQEISSNKKRYTRMKYCSPKCCNEAYKCGAGEQGRQLNYLGLSTASIGAIGELRVSADLLAKGYEVFRAVSSACSCDLIAMKNGVSARIEVRTARRSIQGVIQYPGHSKDIGRQDYFAAVLPDEIIYVPEFP